jgi:hypothetical protein
LIKNNVKGKTMKSKINSQMAVYLLLLSALMTGFSANAGTKQKPPVGDIEVAVVWYQPILDFLSL